MQLKILVNSLRLRYSTTLTQALEEASAISEGGVTDTLKNFLQLNMPKARQLPPFVLSMLAPSLRQSAVSSRWNLGCLEGLPLSLVQGLLVSFV